MARKDAHARKWEYSEDEHIRRNIAKVGTCWSRIVKGLPADRTVAATRNRWMRINSEKRGMNRCTICGQLVRGHSCPGPLLVDRTIVEETDQTDQSRQSDQSDRPVDFDDQTIFRFELHSYLSKFLDDFSDTEGINDVENDKSRSNDMLSRQRASRDLIGVGV